MKDRTANVNRFMEFKFKISYCISASFITLNLKRDSNDTFLQIIIQAWINSVPDADRRSGAHVLLRKKKKTLDLQISSQVDKTMTKLH